VAALHSVPLTLDSQITEMKENRHIQNYTSAGANKNATPAIIKIFQFALLYAVNL
jgi:hypothetical protein